MFFKVVCTQTSTFKNSKKKKIWLKQVFLNLFIRFVMLHFLLTNFQSVNRNIMGLQIESVQFDLFIWINFLGNRFIIIILYTYINVSGLQ